LGLVDGVFAIGDCSTVVNPKLKARAKQLFEEADTDGDKTLSNSELKELFERLRLEGSVTRKASDSAASYFYKFDADGSGDLDEEEFGAWLGLGRLPPWQLLLAATLAG